MIIVADPAVMVDPEVTLGVDTHADTHVAAVIDPLGRHLGDASFATTVAGFNDLIDWAKTFGTITAAGVEGTGSYGSGLARFLAAASVTVIEVDRPDRKTRRDQGKSDTIDAYAAARAVASGRSTVIPKTRTGNVESIRVLRVARTSAVRDRAKALTQLKALIVTAPDGLRAQLHDLAGRRLVGTCARLRPARCASKADTKTEHLGRLKDPTAATKAALASIARRIQTLTTEISELDQDLDTLITETAPTLLGLNGVGNDVAGQLLVTAGDNPERIRNEAAFANLCGVAPIPATSGKTQNRHRLNRAGDRAANASLYCVVICRLRWDAATQAYLQRRLTDPIHPKTKKEVIRCLKRYVAREIYAAIQTDLKPEHSP